MEVTRVECRPKLGSGGVDVIATDVSGNSPSPGRLPDYLMALVFVSLLGGGQEDSGWRWFALPLLQERHSPVRATLILGLAALAVSGVYPTEWRQV